MKPRPSHRLHRHADYQWVYAHGRKQFGKGLGYFYALRPPAGSPDARRSATAGPRVGLTVSKALGKAVDRNRIKRRLREVVRAALPLLNAPVDVILHPRRGARDMPFASLERDVAAVFRAVQAAAERSGPPATARSGPPAAPRAASASGEAAGKAHAVR